MLKLQLENSPSDYRSCTWARSYTILRVKVTWLDFLRICLLSTYTHSEQRKANRMGRNIFAGRFWRHSVDGQNYYSTGDTSLLLLSWERAEASLQATTVKVHVWAGSCKGCTEIHLRGNHECWDIYWYFSSLPGATHSKFVPCGHLFMQDNHLKHTSRDAQVFFA